MTQSNDGDSKKAWNFLKHFRGKNVPINIVSIDPNSNNVEGLTRPVNDLAIFKFIQKYNGLSNLYFMVNTPYRNAPDKKLKKEHVQYINGVWLDADPEESKCYDEERERLFKFADELANDQNPPTYIVDSGNGIQAFWLLEEPEPATKESVILYEAYSRGLAKQHNTDNVQNIDRIMRIPYTWNIPTNKKRELGRLDSGARVSYAASKTGNRYD